MRMVVDFEVTAPLANVTTPKVNTPLKMTNARLKLLSTTYITFLKNAFHFQTINQPAVDQNNQLDQNLKLDEILDICADFEKQIQAEQDELRAIAQRKIAEEQNSIQFGSISFFPSTPPLPAKKAPLTPIKSPNSVNGHQWSPLNTLSPNR